MKMMMRDGGKMYYCHCFCFCYLIRMDLINFSDAPHSSAVVEIAVVVVHWQIHFSVAAVAAMRNKMKGNGYAKIVIKAIT